MTAMTAVVSVQTLIGTIKPYIKSGHTLTSEAHQTTLNIVVLLYVDARWQCNRLKKRTKLAMKHGLPLTEVEIDLAQWYQYRRMLKHMHCALRTMRVALRSDDLGRAYAAAAAFEQATASVLAWSAS